MASKLLKKLTFTIFLSLMFSAAAQTKSASSSSLPKQKLEWKLDENAIEYQVEVKAATGKLYTFKTEENHVDLNVPAGDYQWRVKAYDFLERESSVTEWKRFTVRKLVQPEVTAKSETVVVDAAAGNKSEIEIPISSKNVEKDASVELKNVETAKTVQGHIEGDKAVFPKVEEGNWQVKVRNKSGLETVSAPIAVKDSETEAKRLAEEKRIEEQRKADEAARIAAEKAAAEKEARRIAEEKAAAEAEERRIAEEKAAAEKEAQRIAEEKAAAEKEEQRIEEEKAAAEAEERRVAAEKAAAEKEAQRIAEEKAAAEAEERRIAEEKAAAEKEARRVAEEKAAAEKEAQRVAEEKLLAEEEAAAAKAAAEQREAEEQRIAEEKARLAEEKRLKEEKIYKNCKDIYLMAGCQGAYLSGDMNEFIYDDFASSGENHLDLGLKLDLQYFPVDLGKQGKFGFSFEGSYIAGKNQFNRLFTGSEGEELYQTFIPVYANLIIMDIAVAHHAYFGLKAGGGAIMLLHEDKEEDDSKLYINYAYKFGGFLRIAPVRYLSMDLGFDYEHWNVTGYDQSSLSPYIMIGLRL